MIAGCEGTLMQSDPNPASSSKLPPVPPVYHRIDVLPKVIRTEHIPPYALFATHKCIKWRIEWGYFLPSYNQLLIPSVFSVIDNSINSIDYLNSSSPALTRKTTMSLYYGSKVEGSRNMVELDHVFGAVGMDIPNFKKGNLSDQTVQYMVTERPKLFELYWPQDVASSSEMVYQAGDFIHFWLSETNRYGGIKIVSMSPRTIEVYLALPNP